MISYYRYYDTLHLGPGQNNEKNELPFQALWAWSKLGLTEVCH